MYVLFDVCVGTGFVDCFEKGLYMKRVLKCGFAYCPEVTVCGWQGVENPVTDFRTDWFCTCLFYISIFKLHSY